MTIPPPYVLLDFDARGEDRDESRDSLLFRDPERVIHARELAEVRPALRAAADAAAAGRHVAGFVSYEAAPAFDSAFAVRAGSPVPLAWFGVFRAPEPFAAAAAASQQAGSATWRPSATRAEYAAAVEEIREAIAAGSVYQVNHTMRFHAAPPRDPLAWWLDLRRSANARYAAFVDLGAQQIVSVSPELFFARAGTRVVTRPMKGTARRGRWREEDDARVARLATSEKERAENVMIVDLLRNDLGRVARPGTVRVPRLFAVERYPTVLQMTSTVEAEIAADTSLESLFEALFPCGSVTGAPKVAATRLIATLEDSPRGIYCGAIGHLAPGRVHRAVFSVAIRTALVDADAGVATYGAGGGVTWDSSPGAEYDEAIAKGAILGAASDPSARAQVAPGPHAGRAFELLETMRGGAHGIARLERHLARLEASAAWFGFASSSAEARRALTALATGLPPRSEYRIRLLADAEGRVRVERAPLPVTPSPATVMIAREPVSRHDVFLFHKTTHRAAYDTRRAAFPDAFDVLLWNEEEELTEFTVGNLVLELDGARWTPPRDCGLLAGTFRAELLERGEVRERVLRREELARASGVWLVNSLREWVPVRLATHAGE